MGSRSKTAISNLGVLEGYTGYLVRDDYAGWHQFDPYLVGVQQCATHLILIRHCKGVLELHPNQQKWAGEVITDLREANTAVEQAKTQDHDHLDPQLLANLRARYDNAVRWGITTNRHHHWDKGNHPGYTLARRLEANADQVWLFTRHFAVPWTTTPVSKPSKARNDTKPSPATGTHSPDSPATAA